MELLELQESRTWNGANIFIPRGTQKIIKRTSEYLTPHRVSGKADDLISGNAEISMPNLYDELYDVERGKYISKTLISPQR